MGIPQPGCCFFLIWPPPASSSPVRGASSAFGAGAAIFRLGTVGAGKINPRYGIRFERGIQEYSSLRLNEELFAFYTKEEEVLPPEEMLAAARAQGFDIKK